ncbi:MAG: DUF3667 domain-containing protein [Chitinophagaceae bacterium]|nr:DUF3667 domain-containing protein [Chitinophagaceae bacterium]
MSHFKERKEKNCLNCDSEVSGRFCQVCGQENVEPKETMWGLITHFFHDITHFDGKFFHSLKMLLTKPGFLSKEYVMGRRARHLNPVRMYVFTSALFFILFFTFFFSMKNFNITSSKKSVPAATPISADEIRARALKNAKTKADSIEVLKGLDYLARFTDTTERKKSGSKKRNSFNLFYQNDQYGSVQEYDSVQSALPIARRDGWLKKKTLRKEISINEKMEKEGPEEVFEQWIDRFVHSFPQILFISLPLIALILKLLYIRRRKQFYFTTHAIFLVHIYIYSFINLLMMFTISKISDASGVDSVNLLGLIFFIHAIWYVYKAMRNFYGQRRFKTFVKFLLLNFLTINVIVFLFMISFFFSAYSL